MQQRQWRCITVLNIIYEYVCIYKPLYQCIWYCRHSRRHRKQKLKMAVQKPKVERTFEQNEIESNFNGYPTFSTMPDLTMHCWYCLTLADIRNSKCWPQKNGSDCEFQMSVDVGPCWPCQILVGMVENVWAQLLKLLHPLIPVQKLFPLPVWRSPSVISVVGQHR